jgi:hypothetical protein
LGNAWLLALAGAGDIEHCDLVCADPLPECLDVEGAVHIDNEVRLLMLRAEVDGQLGAAVGLALLALDHEHRNRGIHEHEALLGEHEPVVHLHALGIATPGLLSWPERANPLWDGFKALVMNNEVDLVVGDGAEHGVAHACSVARMEIKGTTHVRPIRTSLRDSGGGEYRDQLVSSSVARC